MKSACVTTLMIRCTRQTIVKTETRITRTIQTETELVVSPAPADPGVNSRLRGDALPIRIGSKEEEKSNVQNHK